MRKLDEVLRSRPVDYSVEELYFRKLPDGYHRLQSRFQTSVNGFQTKTQDHIVMMSTLRLTTLWYMRRKTRGRESFSK